MLARARELIWGTFREAWEPEPRETVSEWADAHRQLTTKASAEPGPWRTSRTPYLREIMDALSPSSPVRKVVLMKGTQIGATEVMLNWMGYVIHRRPGAMLIFRPTRDSAAELSKERLDPMLETTDVLRGLVAPARARDSGNTRLNKDFLGGHIKLRGANSTVGLRSSSAGNIGLDELDEFKRDINAQGDALGLILQRAATYPHQKVFMNSSPTIRGRSNIEREFLKLDRRRYFVPCPHCGHADWIQWKNLRMTEPHVPESIQLLCVACLKYIEERWKTEMLAAGEWRATAPGNGIELSYHVSSFYSPVGWKSWAECAKEFLEAESDPPALKRWLNTCAGESWEERTKAPEVSQLEARCEAYPDGADVIDGVGVLCGHVDVQKDRLEVQVDGYMAGEESALVAYAQIPGDPEQPEVWYELDKFRALSYRHQSGRTMRVAGWGVDSAYLTDKVLRYVKPRQFQKLFALRGTRTWEKEIVGLPSEKNAFRTRVYPICVNEAKARVFYRLRIDPPEPGLRKPGYRHFPEGTTKLYFDGLTAESLMERAWRPGRPATREWVKVRERNEPLDLTVGTLAVLYILDRLSGHRLIRSLATLGARYSRPVKEGGPTGSVGPSAPSPARSARKIVRAGRLVRSWKRW